MILLLAACDRGDVWWVDHDANWPCSECVPQPEDTRLVEEIPQRAADRTDLVVTFDAELEDALLDALPLLEETLADSGTDARIVLVPSDDAALTTSTEALADPELRPDAALHAMFVLAADDAAGDGTAWSEAFAALRPFAADRSVSVVAPADATVVRSLATGEAPVGELADLLEVIEVAGRVAPGLRQTFPLAHRPPDPHAVDVSVRDPSGAEIAVEEPDWVFDERRNAVVMAQYCPKAGAVVVARWLP